MLTPRALGQRGETAAVRYLERKGYRILARNHRVRIGEIDVVARDGRELVFVEVKSRRERGQESRPEESVTELKVSRIIKLAENYIQKNGQEESAWRIDVVAVVFDGTDNVARIDHLQNAVY